MEGPPDRETGILLYSRVAGVYDRMLIHRRVRTKAVRALGLVPGQTVLDAGCGTGINFPQLQAQVGGEGQIIGVDQSPAMLNQAARRVSRAGWKNVKLIESPLEEASLPVVDRLFLGFTHDLLQNPSAVANAISCVRPGGRAVAVCARWDERAWPKLATKAFKWLTSHYVTTFDGFDKPWLNLVEHLDGVTYQRRHLGTVYIVGGTVTDTRPDQE